MVSNGVVRGINISSDDSKYDCIGCIMGKGHRSAIPKVSTRLTKDLLGLVHSDVIGPIEVDSVGGARYAITFIDDKSNWTVQYTMKRKSESLECFKRYKAYAERHTNQEVRKVSFNEFESSLLGGESIKLKCLRSDNGGEYLSNEFKVFLQSQGIKHELTVPYTPQQNGVSERMNRTLMSLVRSMLHHKSVEKRFWAEALATAVYVRNRVTSRSLPKNTTPYHIWHKIKKLEARSREALFMGYPNQSKGYKIWDTELEKFVISRDVKFGEEKSWTPSEKELQLSTMNNSNEPSEQTSTDADTSEELPAKLISSESNTNSVVLADSQKLRRSSRISKPPEEWWKSYGKSSSSSQSKLYGHNVALIASDVPQSYEEARMPENIDFWLPGIRKEEDSIRKNNTFVLVDRKPHMHVLPCRYVFKIKTDVGPKVRIVAKGFRQIHGVDYYDTYAPVVSLTAARLFLAIVAHNDLRCDQMDVVTAFLNGDLDEEVYMEVPAGFRDPKRPNSVCKLLKAIYGLKQAPKQWYAKINSFLVDELNFQGCKSEPCLYLKHEANAMLAIILYVDDLLIAGSKDFDIIKIKEEFKSRFQMKDLGSASEFVGIQIQRDRANFRIHISQSLYAQKILDRFNMMNSKPCSTPMELQSSKMSMTHNEDKIAADDNPYRQAIGSLMYLAL
eukprot:IDg22031t1